MTGLLAVVSTPIGNLGDITERARRHLAEADLIACEDTRRTRALLGHLGLPVPDLVRVDDHTEADRAGELVERIRAGGHVVLVTDAGTPAVSDPGQRVVEAVMAAGLAVEVTPGPSAVIAALVASGIRADRFCFEGFLPRKGSARSDRLAVLAVEERPSVLYESPRRVRALIADLAERCGPDREVAVCRELTKLHEEVWRGRLADAEVHLGEAEPRGEYVVVLDGAPAPEPTGEVELVEALRVELASGSSRRDAVAAVTEAFGVPHRRVYQLALGIR